MEIAILNLTTGAVRLLGSLIGAMLSLQAKALLRLKLAPKRLNAIFRRDNRTRLLFRLLDLDFRLLSYGIGGLNNNIKLFFAS